MYLSYVLLIMRGYIFGTHETLIEGQGGSSSASSPATGRQPLCFRPAGVRIGCQQTNFWAHHLPHMTHHRGMIRLPERC